MKKLLSLMILAVVTLLSACNPTEELKFNNARVTVTSYSTTTNSVTFKATLADPEDELDELVLKVVVSSETDNDEQLVPVSKNQIKTITFENLERETTYLVEIFAEKDGNELRLYTNEASKVTTLAQGDTSADPLEVSTVAEFKAMNNKKYYVQTANLDFEGESMNPLFTSGTPFTGGYDGAGFTISNININDSTHVNRSYLSIFGYVSKSYIKNVTFDNVHIDNTARPYSGIQYVGLVVSKVSNNEFLMENVSITNSSITFQHNVASFDSGSVIPVEEPTSPVSGSRWFDESTDLLYTHDGTNWNEGVAIPTTKPQIPAAGDQWFDKDTDRLHKATRTINRNLYLGLVGGSLQGSLNNITVDGSSIDLTQRGINGAYSGSDVATSGSYVGGLFGLIEQDKGFNIKQLSVTDTTINVNIGQDIKGLGEGSLYVGGLIGAYRSDLALNEVISRAHINVNYVKHAETESTKQDTVYVAGLVGVLTKANINDAIYSGDINVQLSNPIKKVYLGQITAYATKSGQRLVVGGTLVMATTTDVQVGYLAAPYNYVSLTGAWLPSVHVRYLNATSLTTEGVVFDLAGYSEITANDVATYVTSTWVSERFN